MRASRLAAAGVALAAAVGVSVALASPSATGSARNAKGSPDRGKAVYTASNCSVCHEFAPSGQKAVNPSLGPDLATALAADAQGDHMAIGPFTLQSIVDPNAQEAAGYGVGIMQSYGSHFTMQQLDDLVSFLIGSPYSSGIATTSPTPAAVCDRTASCKALVARWVKLGRLPATAVSGAKIFAAAGCQACHRYLGSGTATRAPDLSAEGRKKHGLAWQINHLKCPSCVDPETAMPVFANLGIVTRRQLGLFLEASVTPAKR